LIVEKIAGAVKPVTPTVSAPDKRVGVPNAASAQISCEVVEPTQVSPDSERIIRKVPLAALVVEAGCSVDETNVQILAASFRQTGQTSAILVVREQSGDFRVLSGNHRVMAAGEVGWDRIDAVVLDCNERVQRLVEIAENLHRRKLSVLERAKLVNDWILLVRNEAAQVAHPKGGRQPLDRGFSKAERTLGVSRAEATRSACIASIPQEVAARAIELDLDDNQAALLKVARLSTSELQIAQLQEISERKRASRSNASKPSSSPDEAPSPRREELEGISESLDRRNPEDTFHRLASSWNSSPFRAVLMAAPAQAQARFVGEILLPEMGIAGTAAEASQ
jgi:ParB family chromosome partitioning protein